MSDQLPVSTNDNLSHEHLKKEIAALELKIGKVTGELRAFQASLRAELINEIIEAEELTVLYKQQKQAKKAKRLEQKKRGKNYQEPVGLVAKKKPSQDPAVLADEEKEKKRLYREAMLHVHPDKFAMDEEQMEQATEITAQLIEVYKNGDLEALKAFHAHLLGANREDAKSSNNAPAKVRLEVPLEHLIREKQKLEHQLSELKESHLYHVLKTYQNPMAFVNELRVYYKDRIMKMRKRTRVGKAPKEHS